MSYHPSIVEQVPVYANYCYRPSTVEQVPVYTKYWQSYYYHQHFTSQEVYWTPFTGYSYPCNYLSMDLLDSSLSRNTKDPIIGIAGPSTTPNTLMQETPRRPFGWKPKKMLMRECRIMRGRRLFPATLYPTEQSITAEYIQDLMQYLVNVGRYEHQNVIADTNVTYAVDDSEEVGKYTMSTVNEPLGDQNEQVYICPVCVNVCSCGTLI